MTDQDSKCNTHGLSRDIPNPIKREIRQRCGFGCVCCGSAIYQYEHVDPPFTEAMAHKPDKIALLCGRCHDCVTKGLWSKDKVKDGMQAPKCLEDGFSFGAFDVGPAWPQVVLGDAHCRETRAILVVYGERLLEVEPPEVASAPFRLSGRFYGEDGGLIFEIVRNEWRGPISNWDVELSGPRITIRSGPRRIALMIRVDPPNKLVVERVDMRCQGVGVVGGESGVAVVMPNGQEITLTKCTLGPGEWGVRVEKGVVKLGSVGDGRNGALNIKTRGVGIVFENIAFGHNTISARPGNGEGKKRQGKEDDAART